MSGVVLAPGLVRVTAGARAATGGTEDAVEDTAVAATGVVIMAVADALAAAAAVAADALAAGKYFQNVCSIVDMYMLT